MVVDNSSRYFYQDANVDLMKVGYRKTREMLEARVVCVLDGTVGCKLEVFLCVRHEGLFPDSHSDART